LLMFRDGEMLSAPFDVEHLRLTGAASRTADSIVASAAGSPIYDASPAGTVAYSVSTLMSRRRWGARRGPDEPGSESRRADGPPRLPPDGTRVAVQAGNLWVLDLARGTFTRVSQRDEATAAFPMWSADGRQVYLRSSRGVMSYDTDGSGRSAVIAGTSEF